MHTTRTLDGFGVRPGLIVWDYDLRVSVVSPEQFEPVRMIRNGGVHCDFGGTGWDGFYRMQRADGTRASDMSADRMWVNHPSTGVPAAEVGATWNIGDVVARLREEYESTDLAVRDGAEHEGLAEGSWVVIWESERHNWTSKSAEQINARQCGWFAEPVNHCILALYPVTS